MSNRSTCLSRTVRADGKRKPAQTLRKFPPIWFLVLAVLFLLAPHTAHAATGGGGLPWETPLQTLSNSVTGSVAYSCSLIGIVGAGGVLIFAGGMVNEFLRAVLFCVLVIAFIIAAKNTMTAFGFAAGATVSQVEHVRGAYGAA
jgi:type IV secretory pathway VirB2 component (pilin)